MASYTTNYNLKKPDRVDFIAIQDLNENADTIDTTILAEKTAVQEWAKGTFSNPNLARNGDFQFWHHGTSFTALVSEIIKKYTADGWAALSNYIGNTVEKLIINGENYYKQTFINCVSTSLANIEQIVEDLNTYSDFSGKTATFSAKAKCTTACRCIFIAYTVGGSTSYITTNIDNSNTFKRYSVTATIPDNATNIRYGIGMSRGIDATFNGTETIFGECKFERDSVATPFVPRPHADELKLCQRYCIDLKNNVSKFNAIAKGIAYSSTLITIFFPMPSTMRANPTPILDLTKAEQLK